MTAVLTEQVLAGYPASAVRLDPPGRLDPPVRRLAAEYERLCREAVDPFEIVAGLEADGLSDAAARDRYGHDDVFSLAEELYRTVPRAVPAAGETAGPWRSRGRDHALRGVLFGMPGLCYATAAHAVTTPAGTVVLALSLVASWALSQLVSYLGYVCAGRDDRAGSAAVLRQGLVVGALVTGAVTAAAGALLDAGTGVLVLAVAQGIYLLAATVVLVAGGGLALLVTLAPGTLVSAVFLAGGAEGVPPPAVWAASCLSIGLTAGLAFWRTRGAPLRFPVSLADVRGGMPYAAFGLLAAAMLSLSTIRLGTAPEPGAGSGPAGLALLPLSVSMGAAEWLLFWYRRRSHRLLLRATRPSQFAVRAQLLLVAAIGCYVLVTVALIGLAVLVERNTGAGAPVTRHGAYLVLGTAFFVALLLQSFRRPGVVLAAFSVALAVQVLALAGGAAGVPAPAADQDAVRLVAGLGLFAVVGSYAAACLSQASRHW